jgi:hypothetical protein
MTRSTRLPACFLIGGWTLLLATGFGPVSAHETQSTGPFRVAIGWHDEPAFTGTRNAVEVKVSTAADGSPIGAVAATLQVEVAFGDQVVVLALAPGDGPGAFTAPLVPTQPGRYTFHVSGTVGGQAVDLASTCSEQTFDCVRDIADIQFPSHDARPGGPTELAARVVARADRATDSARLARLLSLVAVVVAVLALAAAAWGWRRRPRSRR